MIKVATGVRREGDYDFIWNNVLHILDLSFKKISKYFTDI